VSLYLLSMSFRSDAASYSGGGGLAANRRREPPTAAAASALANMSTALVALCKQPCCLGSMRSLTSMSRTST
jgi:hypothetical protein